MNLDKIYKRDVSGNIRVWWAEVGEDENEGCWRTHSGTLDGSITASEWKYAAPKSQSGSNEQSIFNANAEMKKKLRLDYKNTLDEIDDTRNSLIRPMLANEYVGWVGPCYAQPKLDGMRCLANSNGLWTRGNKRIIATPHIEKALKDFFAENPDIILDGEMYNHDLHDNFNLLMSLSKKIKPNFEDLERSRQLIQYWVYDMISLNNPRLKFSDRWTWLWHNLFHNYNADCLRYVPTQQTLTEEQLDSDYMTLLEQGFEGQMIRVDTQYEEKRTSNLLKRKQFVDQEFELVDIEEGAGNWEGLAKRAVCALPDGRRFGAGISGTQAFAYQLLHEKDKYHLVTVKYHALTPDGIPRFPIAIKFWEHEFDALEENTMRKKDLFG